MRPTDVSSQVTMTENVSPAKTTEGAMGVEWENEMDAGWLEMWTDGDWQATKRDVA